MSNAFVGEKGKSKRSVHRESGLDLGMHNFVPLFFVLLMACAGDSAKSAQPASELPQAQPAEAGEATPVEAEAVPEEASEVPEEASEATPVETKAAPETQPLANACVVECMDSRRTQATSIEHIKAGCEARCSGDAAETLK